MRKLASDASTVAARMSGAVMRRLEAIRNRPFAGSAVLLAAALLAIATDVAARFGLVPFALALAAYLRRARPNRVSP